MFKREIKADLLFFLWFLICCWPLRLFVMFLYTSKCLWDFFGIKIPFFCKKCREGLENVPSIIRNNSCGRMISSEGVREVLSWSLHFALLRFQTVSLKWRSWLEVRICWPIAGRQSANEKAGTAEIRPILRGFISTNETRVRAVT